MPKKASTLLKEIIGTNQQWTDQCGSNMFLTYGFLTIANEKEKKFVWMDNYRMIVNDPEMLNGLGGEWLIKNKLEIAPTIYPIRLRENHIHIVGEEKNFSRTNDAEQALISLKKNLKEITNLEELSKKGGETIKKRIEYVKKIFPSVKAFIKEKDYVEGMFCPHLYFFEDDLRAVLAPFRF